MESPDPRCPADVDSSEALAIEFPWTRTLGSYERGLLRAGLPIHVPGVCNVCGCDRGFWLRAENFREDLVCPRCRASNRKRQLVAVVLAEIGVGWQGILAEHVRQLPQTIWVMETGRFAEAFRVDHLVTSRYLAPRLDSGRIQRGVRHEDAMNPSFGGETLELVISCDVFEHVADPYLAHRRVFRCLKPGGRHVFTVPLLDDRARDEVRATVEDGLLRLHQPALYHGDPDRPEGALVYRLFSLEMLTRLEEIGFHVKLARVHSLRFAMLGANGLVFVAQKPAH